MFIILIFDQSQINSMKIKEYSDRDLIHNQFLITERVKKQSHRGNTNNLTQFCQLVMVAKFEAAVTAQAYSFLHHLLLYFVQIFNDIQYTRYIFFLISAAFNNPHVEFIDRFNKKLKAMLCYPFKITFLQLRDI